LSAASIDVLRNGLWQWYALHGKAIEKWSITKQFPLYANSMFGGDEMEDFEQAQVGGP
jgi:hypothetical protein